MPATRLERRRGTAQSIHTQNNVAHLRHHHHQLQFGHWHWIIFALTRKVIALVEEAKRYRLEIIGSSSTKMRGSGTVDLDGGYKLFHSGTDPKMSAHACVGILTSPQMSDCASEWISLG